MTTASKQKIIEQILRDPEAPTIINHLSEIIEKEKKARVEFYNSISTEELKTEFINGEVIIQSPVKKVHHDICFNLYKILDAYVTINDLGYIGCEKLMIRLTRNDYEPDLSFFRQEIAKDFKEDQNLFPAPDLVVEICSKKTEHRDRGIKFDDYAKHGIQEYWIINPTLNIVEQYLLNTTEYQLLKKSESGKLSSPTIEGLILDIESIFDRKLAQKEMLRMLK